ncbi:DUF2238 domain-containing protein [Arcobacter defluvii]|uniref:DUF2238 domain-containing membrane protein n=1 Tax=Arcobacter defluvii TaxID=873191 RepID=A0AAE7BB76_9BACT|nr:DUF2238 domain-containing protein [Arcobacter defluvii]QKF76285.1 DUF2238 domain-containing membrane protein [Arcobacter defluvii]RXI30967.1 hypothetical protein CP964_10940 [Arcobacter defluvii]
MIKIWIFIYFSFFIWSLINPKDLFTWFLEVFPAIIGFIVLFITYKKFQFTNLIYFLILMHCIILMIGGHYTYAEVPFFDYVKEFLNQDRNNYDKIGHLAQGFVPAMIARELIIRKNIINTNVWRNFFIICFCLALSALYEIVEWLVAITTNDAANDFLGTQGYIWDTQSDMTWALVGSIIALLSLSKYHDKVLQKTLK